LYAAAGVVTFLVVYPHLISASEPPPAPWVTPMVIDFGPVGVGSTSPEQTVTITNTGDVELTGFAGGGVTAPFFALQNCAGGVAPGSSCQYFFTFSPTAAGTFSAVSSSGTSTGPFSIELRGEGVGAGLHVTPLALDFGSVHVGSTAPTQTVTIRNTGMSTLTNFAGGGVYAPFTALQNCASGVEPGETCEYFFGFSPSEATVSTAISSSGTNAGSFSIELEGRGRSLIFGSGQRVTPRSLDFGPVGVGLSSGPLTVNVTNQNPFSTITSFAGGGVGAPFSAGQNCAPELSANSTCQFFYTFSPIQAGTFTATSTVTDSVGSFSIELRGEGVGADLSVSPLALDFGPVPVGGTGVPQTVTIKNTGMAELSSFAGGGVYAPFSASQNCAGGVAPGETCQFSYSFNPTEAGLQSATSHVSTNGGSFSILLIGGIDTTIFTDGFELGDTSQWAATVP